MEIAILLLLPIFSSLVLILNNKQSLWSNSFTVISTAIQTILSLVLIGKVLNSGTYSYTRFLELDSLGAFMLFITTFVGFAVYIYNIGYFQKKLQKQIVTEKQVKQASALINLFLLAMYLAILSTTPILTWIAIEATTLTTVFLVSFYGKTSDIEAAWKYLIINSVGLLLAFLGTIIYLANASSLVHNPLITWQNLLSVASKLNPQIIQIGFILIIIGYGTKMGVAPMHTWKPDTYSKAPVPVVALLSSALLNITFLPILKFKLITDQLINPTFTQNLMMFFGVFSIAIAALAMFNQQNYKRLLAYSSIEHAGIIMLGFAFGGIGIFASVLHMLYHALAKSALFLLAGNIEIRYNSTNINNIKGLVTALPVTGTLFTLGFIAISGLPPFGLFLTKFYTILSGFYNHSWLILFVIAMLGLVFFGFLRQISIFMFGELPKDITKGENDLLTTLPIVMLIGLLLILSVFIPETLQSIISNILITFKAYG